MAESCFGEPLNLAVNCAGIVLAKTIQKKSFLGNTLSFATRLFKDASNQHSWIISSSPAGSTKDGVGAAAASHYHCAFREIARVWRDNSK
jgi:hypothetical protein